MKGTARLRWCATSLGVLIAASAQAQFATGRTTGEAAVTAAGAASYSIPLVLPPGTNGVGPALAIDYDSRGGNGLLGVGFRLAGLSKIHRCAGTLAQDGQLAAVALDAGDQYCLDGQRLRLAAGVHGQAGAEYRTEVDSLVRVTAYGTAGNGPAWFKAEHRNGLVYEYGVTPDSRIESLGSATPRAWAVNRVLDRSGNYATFAYVEDAASGAYRPTRIDYTGNSRTGAAPYYSVQFTYEARPADDRPGGYFAGGAVRESARLGRIDVVHVTTLDNLRSYRLTYDAPGSTGRSRLARVQECARSTCLPATRLEWSNGQPGWAAETAVRLAAERWAGAIPGDFDGNGFDDLAYFDPASGSWWLLHGRATGFATVAIDTGAGAGSDATRAMSVDLDGDGRSELLVPQNGFWHWLRSAPSGGYAYGPIGVPDSAMPGVPVAADLDGDGREDLVFRSAAGESLRWLRSLAGAGNAVFAPVASLWSVPAGSTLATVPFAEGIQRFRSVHRHADVNGDGRTDVLVLTVPTGCAGAYCVSQGRWHVLASTGTALASQAVIDGASDVLLADINADGLTDIAYAAPNAQWQLLLGAGSRGSAPATLAGPVSTSVPAAGGVALAADWNGDGRTDLLQVVTGGALVVCRSDGATFQGCQPAGATLATASASPAVLDANGDDLHDLVYATSAGVRWLPRHAAAADLLLRVTDGLGAESSFTYALLTDRAVHVAGTAAVFPVRDHVRPGRVVATATLATDAGTRRESYTYEGARLHVQGRGFLGFARRTTLEFDSGLTRVEEYLQDPAAFDRLGRVTAASVRQSSGRLLAHTAYGWSRHLLGSGYQTRAVPFLATVTADRFELDGVHVVRVEEVNTVDTFGTVVRRYVSTREIAKGVSPGAQYVEVTTLGGVVNDVQYWCLGKPATMQVSRQHNLPAGAQVVRSTTHAWDYAQCRATQSVVEPSSSTLRVTTDYGYDAHGNLANVSVTPIDQPVRTTAYDWGTDGRFRVQVTNAEGHVTRTDWNPSLAVPTRLTDPNGLVTQLQYDDLGRTTLHKRPDGTSLSLARFDCGPDCPSPDARYAIRVTSLGVGGVPLGFAETGYDRHERAVYARAEQPAGQQVLTARRYDALGRLAQESLPATCCATPPYWTSHSYDLLGRRVRQVVPGSPGRPTPATTSWRYDGLTVTETDPLGRNTVRTYDATGALARTVDAALAATDYAYDAFGNLVRTRDARGAAMYVAYDSRGRRTSLFDPSAGLWLYRHYPLGELRSQTNARGQTTSFVYDRLARPLTRTEPEGITTWTWGQSREAHNVGALAAVQSAGLSRTHAYDALGRPSTVTSTVQGTPFVTSFSYDTVSGLRETLTYPAPAGSPALRVRHRYDRGRLVELTDADTGASFWRLDALDARGLVTGESLGNGVRVTSLYDPVSGLLTERTAGIGGGTSHQNLAYEWDVAGNLTRRTERNSGTAESFAYDALDRLDNVQRAGALSLDLAYDAVGNLTYKSDVGEYRYDPARPNAVVTAGTNAYEHDANGAIVKASGTNVSWFSFDLPSRIQHPAGNYSTFKYGPDRQRIQQLARGASTVTETIYAADGLYELVRVNGGTSHRHYIMADGRRVAVHTRTDGAQPETVYLLEDQLGGVDGFTAANGELLSRNSYQPFGAHRGGDWRGTTPTTTEWQQILSTTPRGYTDHEHLNNLGVIHMNGRVYDPVLGRFLSPDPIVQAPHDTQGFNRYAYVRNNPLRYTDPSGFCFNGHPAGDLQAQSCMEQILVTAFGITDWQMSQLLSQADNFALFAGMSEAGSLFQDPSAGAATMEEVIVAASPMGPDEATSLAPVLPGFWAFGWDTIWSRSLAALSSFTIAAGLIAVPAEISETSDLSDENGDPRHVYHFTNETGRLGISTSGVLMPGPSGLVFFSAIPYQTASQAQNALALPRTPTGYFAVPRGNIHGPLTWTTATPNYGNDGGGLEASFPGVVPLRGAEWFPIRD